MPLNTSLPRDGVAARKADEREFKTLVATRIGGLPDSFSDVPANKIAAVGPSGVVVASSTYTADGNAIVAMKTGDVELTTSITLNDAVHLGRFLYYFGASNITITVNPGDVAASQVSDGFACNVFRGLGAGRVAFVLDSTLRNQDRTGRLAIAEGGLVVVKRRGTALLLKGELEA